MMGIVRLEQVRVVGDVSSWELLQARLEGV